MTAPHVLSPEEWDAQQTAPVLSPEAWDAQQRAAAPRPLRPMALPSASADVTREVGGLEDPERWKTTIHKPGTVEQLATGMLGLPFAAVKAPIETARGLIAGLADPVKAGRFVNQKLRGQRAPMVADEVGMRAAGTPYRGPLRPETAPLSDVEGYGALLNAGLMAGGALKAHLTPEVTPPAVVPRIPRPGIGRIAAADVRSRPGPVTGVGSVLDQLRAAVATEGDVPLKVPMPPSERSYPLGATTGDLIEGGVRKPFVEPAPTPFTRPGVRRLTAMPETARPLPEGTPVTTSATRAAADLAERIKAAREEPAGVMAGTSESFPAGYSTTGKVRRAGGIPSPQEWEAGQRTGAPATVAEPVVASVQEPVPAIGEPVSFGRDLAEPGRIPADAPSVQRPRGVEPVGTVQMQEGAASVGLEKVPTAEPTTALESVPTLPSVEGTGELKTRGLAQSVNVKAVAERLTTSLGDLPEYRTIDMADQAARAAKLLGENPELAHRIARGDAPPPADLLPESVFTAVENKAIADGDVGTLRDLASGDLTAQATTMGQRLRALGERSPESPVAAMQKIVDARTKGVKHAAAATEAAVQDLQRHIAEAAKMDPGSWATFIDSLRC